MVKVINKNGQPLPDTTRNGKVRRLLKDKKARVVNGDPFTIQLLYDTTFETEDNTMNIVITNDTHTPKGFTSSTKMTYDEFLHKSKETPIEADTLYFDIDGLTEELYNDLKTSETFEDIKFFRFNTNEFVKNKVMIVKAKNDEVDRFEELQIRLTPEITTQGHILVSGAIGSGKTTLLKNMACQLVNHGVDVEFITRIPVFDTNEDSFGLRKTSTDVGVFATIIESIRKEMMNRFSQMEEEQVNSIYKLKNKVKSKALIIDGLDNYIYTDDYRSVYKIKTDLGTIARLGRAAGIMFIVSCQRPGGVVVSSDLAANIPNRIITGKITDAIVSHLMFDKEVHVNIPFGMGIYQNKCSDSEKDEFTIFTVNDVKTF